MKTIASLVLLLPLGGAGATRPATALLAPAALETLEQLQAAVEAAKRESALNELQVLDFSQRALAVSKAAGEAKLRCGALGLSCGLRFRGVSPDLDRLRGELWDLVIANDADAAALVAPLVFDFLEDQTRARALAQQSKSPEVRALCALVPLKDLLARQPRQRLDEAETQRLIAGLKGIQQEFGGVVDPLRQKTWNEICGDLLFHIEHLSIGAQAPEIEAQDTSGQVFKLSDSRGKVVLLDFWGHWCIPSRELYGQHRSVVARLKDQPFVLLGVNSDADLQRLAPVLEQEAITWRSFWNGPDGTKGPISKRWGVSGWPTLYLIDAQGKIRHKFAGSPGDEKLDAAIDALVEEATQASGKK